MVRSTSLCALEARKRFGAPDRRVRATPRAPPALLVRLRMLDRVVLLEQEVVERLAE
jgi:hypothetical protein